MPEQEKRVKTIEGLKELRAHFRALAGIASSKQGRANHIESAKIPKEEGQIRMEV